MEPLETSDIMRWFSHSHLTGPGKEISAQIEEVAWNMAAMSPNQTNPELEVGLRKLLEAKDCFVRAGIEAKEQLSTSFDQLGAAVEPLEFIGKIPQNPPAGTTWQADGHTPRFIYDGRHWNSDGSPAPIRTVDETPADKVAPRAGVTTYAETVAEEAAKLEGEPVDAPALAGKDNTRTNPNSGEDTL